MRSTATAGSHGEQVDGGDPPDTRYLPRSRIVSVEQTTNMGGGRCGRSTPVHAGACRRRASTGLRSHMDGARLMNAVVGVRDERRPSSRAASTPRWLDFTKGLGRAGRRRAVRLARADRPGRGAGSSRWGGDLQPVRGSWRPAACTRSTTTSSGSPRTTTTRACSPRAAELGCEVDPPGDEHRHLQRARRASSSDGAARVELSGTPDGRVRAVTHLDVSRATIDSALGGARLAATLTRRGKGLLLVRKGPAFGHSRSHSMVATKRRFNPNLQKVRIDVGAPPARVRLHALPQGGQGHQGALAAPWL
jgi:hypothetical protein